MAKSNFSIFLMAIAVVIPLYATGCYLLERINQKESIGAHTVKSLYSAEQTDELREICTPEIYQQLITDSYPNADVKILEEKWFDKDSSYILYTVDNQVSSDSKLFIFLYDLNEDNKITNIKIFEEGNNYGI